MQVRAARQARGWSQAQLAEVLGLDASGVSRLEAGRKRIGLAEAVRIASALGVNLDRLVAPTTPYAELERAVTAGDDAVVAAREAVVEMVTALGQVVGVAARVGEEITQQVLGDADAARSLAVRVSSTAVAGGSARVPESVQDYAPVWVAALGDRIAGDPTAD